MGIIWLSDLWVRKILYLKKEEGEGIKKKLFTHRKNVFSRAFTIKQVEEDSETDGRGNEAMVLEQGIYELEWVLSKEGIPDLITNGTRYSKEVLRRGRGKWNQEDLLANCICHLLTWQCVIK